MSETQDVETAVDVEQPAPGAGTDEASEPEQVSPEVQAAVDAALVEVDLRCATDPELVHGDVVEQVALTLPVDVAVALCAQTMSFVPDTVRRMVFEAEHADTISAAAAVSAEREAAEQKAANRSAKAAATRAATLAAEAAAHTAAIRSNTCPSCFQVRSPSGVCGCDE